MRRALALAFLVAATASAREGPQDWPQWLGPTRDGRAAAAWPAKVAPRVAWQRPLGGGSAGVVAGGGRAYTLFADEESEVAVAFEVASGRELWRARLDPLLAPDGGPASTPALSAELLYTLSSACQLRALRLDTGQVAWHRDLKKDFAVQLRRGCATSPLLEGAWLVVQGGGRENDQRVMALDPASGRTVWTARGKERTTYTSPVVAEIGGVRQLVVHHTVYGASPTSGLMGLRLSDQSVLWSTAFDKLSFDTPLVLPGAGGSATIVLGSWSDMQAVRVAAAGSTFRVEPLWRTGDLSSFVSPPVFRDGHLYGFGGDFLACLDAASGRTVWKERTYPGSAILIGDRLVVLSVTAGLLRVVAATPAGYREEARLEVLNRGARAEAPPSLAAGHVLVRNDEELVAVRLGS